MPTRPADEEDVVWKASAVLVLVGQKLLRMSQHDANEQRVVLRVCVPNLHGEKKVMMAAKRRRVGRIVIARIPDCLQHQVDAAI